MLTKKEVGSFIKLLPEISKYVLGISLITYLSGFIITTIYLGSLGVNNLNLFRARYIIVGVVFLLFCISVFYVCDGLNKIIRTTEQIENKKKSLLIFQFLMENFGAIFFATNILSTIESSLNRKSQLFSETQSISFNDFFISIWRGFYVGLRAQVLIFVLLVLLIVIVEIIRIIKKKSTIQKLKETLCETIFNKAALIYILRINLFYLMFIVANNLLVSILIDEDQYLILNPHFPETGFFYFFLGILVIFLMYFSIVFLYKKKTNGNSKSEKANEEIKNPLNLFIRKIYMFGLLVAILIPVYTFGIYKTIPQQLGGGKEIEIDIVFSGDEYERDFTCDKAEFFLVDRALEYSVIAVNCGNDDEVQILEISNSIIDIIIY